MLLADTAADGSARLCLLDDVADHNNSNNLKIVVDTLIDASSLVHFSRFVGSEIHGSRPSVPSWHPLTREEAVSYVTECTTRLADFAEHDNALGKCARTGLAKNVRGLLAHGFIDVVENVVRRVRDALGAWLEPLEGLGHFLRFDAEKVDPDVARRVSDLIAELEPHSLEARVRHLVTEMPYDYPCGEDLDFEVRDQRQLEAVRELAAELAGDPAVLERVLPRLSRGEQRKAHVFGRALAGVLASPLDWLEPIVSAFMETPPKERNPDLLAAYVAGMDATYPEAVDAFKSRVAQSPDLVWTLPLICFGLRITPSDIPLALGALEAGLLAPSHLIQWTVGRSLDDLPIAAIVPLFDALFEHSADAFAMGVDLMAMYTHGDRDKLEALRPQVRRASECVMRWNQSRPYQMAVYHFGQLLRRILENGREDPDARAIALSLARGSRFR